MLISIAITVPSQLMKITYSTHVLTRVRVQMMSGKKPLLLMVFSKVPCLLSVGIHIDTVLDYYGIAAIIRAGLPADHNLVPSPQYVEVWYSDVMWKAISDWSNLVRCGAICPKAHCATQTLGMAE